MAVKAEYISLDEALRSLNIHDQTGPVVQAVRLAVSGSSGIARVMGADYSPEVLEMLVKGNTFLTEVVRRDLAYIYEGVKADLSQVPEYDPRMVISLVNPPADFPTTDTESFIAYRARCLAGQLQETQPTLEALIAEVKVGSTTQPLGELLEGYRSISAPYRRAQFKVSKTFNPLHLA